MFIDVTRYGGMRMQRLAIAAIAYLDAVEGGCAVHLIGGETLRVNEDVCEVEARCVPPAPPAEIKEAPAIASEVPEVAPRRVETIVHRAEVDSYPAKRQARGRNGR